MGGIGNSFNKGPQMNVGQSIKKVAGQASAAAGNAASEAKNIEKKPVDLRKDMNQVKNDIKSAKTGPTDQVSASIASEKAEFAATLRNDSAFLDAVTQMVSTQGSGDDVMETAKLTALVKSRAQEFLSPEAYTQFAESIGLPESKDLVTRKINSAENADPAQQDQAVSKLVNFIAGAAVDLSHGTPGC